MGKTIAYESIRTGSVNVSYNSVYYKSPFVASISLVENDLDPLHRIDVVLTASIKARGSSSTAYYTSPSGVAICRFQIEGESGRYSMETNGTSVHGSGDTDISKAEKIKTIVRTNEPQTLVGTLTRTSSVALISNSFTRDQEVSIVIPPLKQNITDENCRITYTVGGVKYDVLNYK